MWHCLLNTGRPHNLEHNLEMLNATIMIHMCSPHILFLSLSLSLSLSLYVRTRSLSARRIHGALALFEALAAEGGALLGRPWSWSLSSIGQPSSSRDGPRRGPGSR